MPVLPRAQRSESRSGETHRRFPGVTSVCRVWPQSAAHRGSATAIDGLGRRSDLQGVCGTTCSVPPLASGASLVLSGFPGL